MRFKKPKNIEKDLALIGGMAVGSMVSKGVHGLIPAQTSTNASYATRGALVLAFGATGMFVSGDDTGANLVRGAAFGAAITQVLELVKEVSTSAGVKSEAESEGQIGKFVARMVGLGCPCDEQRSIELVAPAQDSPALNRWNGRGLRGVTDDYQNPDEVWKNAISL